MNNEERNIMEQLTDELTEQTHQTRSVTEFISSNIQDAIEQKVIVLLEFDDEFMKDQVKQLLDLISDLQEKNTKVNLVFIVWFNFC